MNDIIKEIRVVGLIKFQHGPVQETGVNGCQNEDLLSIVIHRLGQFQMGMFPCDENSQALACLRDAMYWLEKRTADRKKRGVEGVNQK